MTDETAERLIAELLRNPQKFDDEGTGYQLLQGYFRGHPVETLRPLLHSENVLIQRSAAFIASELGGEAKSLIDDVIPLLDSTDVHVKSDAMSVLTACCEGEHAGKFAHVVRMLETDHKGLRAQAMRFVSNVGPPEFEASLQILAGTAGTNPAHERGLRILIAGDQVDSATIEAMVHDAEPLVRKYGIIAAKRLYEKFEELIKKATTSDDPEVRDFAR